MSRPEDRITHTLYGTGFEVTKMDDNTWHVYDDGFRIGRIVKQHGRFFVHEEGAQTFGPYEAFTKALSVWH